jgi:F420-non-reducing hydrogenase iron-sulfur subunit
MFEPRIVCFFCRWCTYAGADLAGTSRKQYPPNGVVVRVNCSGRVDPQHILWAFREGADGVLIGGCHPHDCHYQDGNYNTMRRVALLKPLLAQMGIEPERLRLEWISAAEGEKLVHVMSEFVDTVTKLGPLDYGPIAETVGGRRPSARPVAKKVAAAKKAAPKTPKRPAKTGKKAAKPPKKTPKKPLAKPPKRRAKTQPKKQSKKTSRRSR